MQDYFKPQKIVADYLYFYYRGKKFSGKGVTEWNPETGFELDIFLSQNAGLERVEARGLRVSEPLDFCSIRIWTAYFGWAIVPNFPIQRYETDLLGSGKYFPIRFNRMYFCEPGGNSLVADTYWTGNCLWAPLFIQTLLRTAMKFQWSQAHKICNKAINRGALISIERKKLFFRSDAYRNKDKRTTPQIARRARLSV